MFFGERIYLRKVTEEDALTYHRWRNDPEVMENTSLSLDLFTYKETSEFIQSIMESHNSKSYFIMEKENDEAIGITSLMNLDYKNRNSECIIDIGNKDYWGDGYGKEGMELLVQYSFKELNLHKLYLKVFAFNTRAIRLYERIGFEREGELKDHLFRNGKWHNIIEMALFQDKYLQTGKNA